MKVQKTILVAMILAILLPSFSVLAQTPRKPRVAVIGFDYATVRNYIDAIFGETVDVGQGIADLLVEKLVQNGSYSVIERSHLDRLLAEQNLGTSGRLDPTTATRLGRLLGVDVIVMGSITQFGSEEQKKVIGGGGGSLPFIGGIGFGKKKTTANVGINFRMVSVETGEILQTGSAQGESSRGGTSLVVGGLVRRAVGGGVIDMSTRNFAETIIGEAVHKAVDALSMQVIQKAASVLPPQHQKVALEGLVAAISGPTMVINLGKKSGVKVGDRLEVRRVANEIKDPATGKVIHRMANKIGEIIITEVHEEAAVGLYAGAPAQVKDMVSSAL